MPLNGDGPRRSLESFEDVDHEFRNVRRERANDVGEVMQALGGLTTEVAGVRREVGDVKRVMIEGGTFRHATDDTGSHELRETYRLIKAQAEDPSSPLRPGDVRTIVEDVTETMRLRAEVGTWRKIKAFPRWALRKAAEKALEWIIVATLAATAAELYHLLHR